MQPPLQNVGPLIRKFRKRSGLQQKELAKAARVPRSWLSVVELGRVGVPNRERLIQVARALKLEPNVILSAAGLSTDIVQVPEERSIKEIAHELVAAVDRDKEGAPLIVRQMAGPSSAGPEGYAEPEYWSYWPRDHERGHHFQAVSVVGECLLSRVRPGESVIIDQDASPRTGDIVVARHEGAMLVKEFRKVNSVPYLASETLPPIAVNETTVILGVVVAITRRP